jgi:uncharacterized protein YuzE
MAKINTKIIYDNEEDILFLSKKRTVRASINIGDFIVDIDMNGFVSGIEILDASKTLKLKKSLLKDLSEASMAVTYKPDYLLINLILMFNEKEKEVAIPLTVDLGHNAVSSKTMNFAVA